MIFRWSHGPGREGALLFNRREGAQLFNGSLRRRSENSRAARGRFAPFLAPLAHSKRAPEFGEPVPGDELGF